MKPVSERRAQLEARRVDLIARMQGIERDLEDSGDTKDWEDLATERDGDEVLEDLGNSALAELRMIDAALIRIAEGEYGYCVYCGAEIQEARLDLLPGTPFCQHHADAANRR